MSENNVLPQGSVPLAGSVPVGTNVSTDKGKVVYQLASPIIIELLDSRKIEMAKPNMSLSDKIAGVLQNVSYKEPSAMEIERNRVKSLLYIASIDGVIEPKIADPIMRSALEQKIGDEYLDAIFLAWAENFPAVDKAVLKITKKS